MNASRTLVSALLASTALVGFGSQAIADSGPVADPAGLPISLDQAMSIALQNVPGSVVAAELESDDGSVLWQIDVLDGTNRTVEFEIDANTGVVLASESDDEDGDDEDEDDHQDEADDEQTEATESQDK